MEIHNSQLSIFPYPDERPIDQFGLTKVEYCTIQLVAAHFTAHGKYPDPNQMEALCDCAIWMLDRAIPSSTARAYPAPAAEDPLDPEDQLKDLEIDQPGSPFHQSTFTEE